MKQHYKIAGESIQLAIRTVEKQWEIFTQELEKDPDGAHEKYANKFTELSIEDLKDNNFYFKYTQEASDKKSPILANSIQLYKRFRPQVSWEDVKNQCATAIFHGLMVEMLINWKRKQ